MKKSWMTGILVFLSILQLSCKKDPIKTGGLSSLITVNAILDGQPIKLKGNASDSALKYNKNVFNIIPNSGPVYLYPSGDSLNPYFDSAIPVKNGEIYSLYLFGEAKNIDTMLVKEEIPPYFRDSTIAVRLVNLCKGSAGLSLNTVANPGISLFSGVNYKSQTGFVRLPLPAPVPAGTVSFQVRDANGNLLSNYTIPSSPNADYNTVSTTLSRNRCLTLVVKGMVGASGVTAPGMFPVANY